jgi:hypothetical protein
MEKSGQTRWHREADGFVLGKRYDRKSRHAAFRRTGPFLISGTSGRAWNASVATAGLFFAEQVSRMAALEFGLRVHTIFMGGDSHGGRLVAAQRRNEKEQLHP